MKYVVRSCLFFIVLFLTEISGVAQDIALHKSYTLSISPNYPYTAPSSDKSSLTDGVYSKGYFWAAKSTVGWEHVPVFITIDLEQSQPISSVTFNTVRRQDQFVNFPKNIFVFVSNDDENYQYAGDAADDTGNVPGPYLVKKFVLNNIKATGRYIKISVIPNGTFVFCDEIEVWKGAQSAGRQTYPIAKNNLKLAEDSIKNIEFLKQNLRTMLNKLRMSHRNANFKRDAMIDQIGKSLRSQNISDLELQDLKRQVGVMNVQYAQIANKTSFLIQRYNPWDTLNQFYLPDNSSPLPISFNYYIPKGLSEYGSLVVTNTTTSAKTFQFILNQNGSSASIDLFIVRFVPTANGDEVPDPLVKVDRAVKINAGYTQMLFFKVQANMTGSTNFSLVVQTGSEKKIVKIKVNVFDASVGNNMLNANVWAYFTRPILSDRKEEAIIDLLDHHINTMVVPPAVIPNLVSSNYTAFNDYLSNFKGVKNILLFMNYAEPQIRSGYSGGQFMSDDWKAKFIKWYYAIRDDIQQIGLGDATIYVYPYDEVYGNNVSDFKAFATWAKNAIPYIQFYATLANQTAVNELLPLLDVAQIQSNFAGIQNLPPHSSQVWIYSGSAPARNLSPYRFYRLMSWTAFANGDTGIGFWNYADEGINKNLNYLTDPLIYPSNSYSVIYDGPAKEIISTRRWEAFKLGIEDYSLLQAYARRIGPNKAKSLASDVIQNPLIENKADSARKIIITALQNH